MAETQQEPPPVKQPLLGYELPEATKPTRVNERSRCWRWGSRSGASCWFWRGLVLPSLVVAGVSLLFVGLGLVDPALNLAGTRDVKAALRALLLDRAVLFTGSNLTAAEALQDVLPKANALLVVTLGPSRPTRRADGVPFLTVGPDLPLPTGSINLAAATLEEVLGRKLFPVRIEAVVMPSSFMQQQGLLAGLNPAPRVHPVAVWEVGSGLLMVDRQLVGSAGGNLWGDAKVQHMFDSMGALLFTTLSSTLRASTAAASAASSAGTDGSTSSFSSSFGAWVWRPDRLENLMGPALALAISAAFAMAPPLWFCIMCPAVLGLLAPLLINIGLNQLAGWLCVHFSLPDDQCFDLLVGALGLGFVLALASAVPIFWVCRLQECASPGGLGGVQRLRLHPRGSANGGGLWRRMGGSLLTGSGDTRMVQ